MKILEAKVGMCPEPIPAVPLHKFLSNKYIAHKENLLRDFGVPQDKIDSINWESFKTEEECDRYCRTLVMAVGQ